MTKPETKQKDLPRLSPAEEARRDAGARREYEAGEGIPGEDVRSWLQARIDGRDVPMPRARKLR